MRLKVKAKAIDCNENKTKEEVLEGRDASNYFKSDGDFPTYIYEPKDIMSRRDEDVDNDIDEALSNAVSLVDEANEELKDYCNDIAASYETKDNTDELDLLRDLFTISVKEGYNYGFSIILELDDLHIEGLNDQLRSKIENNIKSFALKLMKEIANELRMVDINEDKAEDEDDDLKEKVREIDKKIDECVKRNDEKEFVRLANERNNLVRRIMRQNKGQDSAEVQTRIEVGDFLAKTLIENPNVNWKDNTITFSYEGKETRISVTLDIEDILEVNEDGDFDSNLLDEILENDDERHEHVINLLKDQEAFLEIWL